MPSVAGFAHVALTVTDLPRSRAFWSDVLGLHVLDGTDSYCALLTGSPTLAPVILTTHEESAGAGAFSEFTTGLDHLCLAVDTVQELDAWQAQLDAHGVTYSRRRSEWGHHVNLRDPDNIAVELFVLEPDADMEAILAAG